MSSLTAAVLCLVVGVSDGDTITVRCDNELQERIRLVEIDAPERRQPFGHKSKRALSDLIYGETVVIERHGRDRYKRTLAQISFDGLDVNREMVRRGLAWCYRQYLKDQKCLADEQSARNSKLGLWSESEPTPPWKFRHQ